MKAAAALVVLVAFGVLAGRAGGDLVPPPPVLPVPPVTLPVPPVAVPLPPVPKLPAPALPAPPLPTAPAAPAPVSAPAASAPVQAPTPSVLSSNAGSVPFLTKVSVLSSRVGSARSASLGGSSQQGSASQGRPSIKGQPSVKRFRVSRPWIGTTGRKRRRSTILTFVLPRAARVVFTVKQVSPGCQTIGRFTVQGRAGLNRVRFAGRVRGKQLSAGTYRISARIPGARTVKRVTLVVVDGSAPTKAELASARASNVCSAARRTASVTPASDFRLASEPQDAQSSPAPKVGASASGSPVGSTPGGILGSTAEKTARAVRPALIALLAASILLLGLASLPRVALPDPRLNEMLARHRLEIAGVGTMAFVAVVISFLIG